MVEDLGQEGQWIVKPKLPLGSVRDLNQEHIDQARNIQHIELQTVPEVLAAFHIFSSAINVQRRSLGLKAMDFAPDHLRLIPRQVFDADPFFQVAESVGGLHDSLSRLAFVPFDRELFAASRLERVGTIYVAGHELNHHGMEGNGIADYSTQLNEGLTDLITRDVVEGGILPRHVTPAENQARKGYATAMPFEQEGVAGSDDDIILELPDEGGIAYRRFPQIRLVQKINSDHPESFPVLLRHAYEGNPEAAQKVIVNLYGSDVANAMEKTDAKAGDLLALLS